MNFSEMYSSALDHELGTDDSTRLFTTLRRQRAVNRGHLEFCDLTQCAIRQSTLTCSNGVREYNLLSTVNIPGGDYLRMAPQLPEYQLLSSGSSKSTTFIAGPDLLPRREVQWLNQYDPGWRGSTGGTPTAYYERMDGGQRLFGLTPPPLITSSESGKVLLPYYAKPSSMTADTHVPFTFVNTTAVTTTREDLEPYHQALVHYAAYQLEKLRRDWEASERQLQLFLGYVTRYKVQSEPVGGQQVRFGRNYFTEVRQQRGRDDWTAYTPYPWRK